MEGGGGGGEWRERERGVEGRGEGLQKERGDKNYMAQVYIHVASTHTLHSHEHVNIYMEVPILSHPCWRLNTSLAVTDHLNTSLWGGE